MGVKVRLVEGAPVTIGQKKLRPVMRVVSWYRRQAVVRKEGSSGFGLAAAWLQPVAVVEETAGHRRRIPIRDETGRAMLRLLVVALAVPVVLSLLTWLVRARD
jgi:hypothetical protein